MFQDDAREFSLQPRFVDDKKCVSCRLCGVCVESKIMKKTTPQMMDLGVFRLFYCY